MDLRPSAQRMADLVAGVDDAQLTDATPCNGTSLGALLDHVGGLSLAFTAAATKDIGEGPATQAPSADASNLGDDWRTRVPDALGALAQAWSDDGAWIGMTKAGGVDLPADVAGLVALDELVVHGWDVARASGQPYDPDERELAPLFEFVQGFVGSREAPKEGLLGPRSRCRPKHPCSTAYSASPADAPRGRGSRSSAGLHDAPECGQVLAIGAAHGRGPSAEPRT